MRRLLRVVTEHPVWVLIGVFGVTAFLVSKLVDLESGEILIRLDQSVNRLLPKESEDRAFYEHTRLVFMKNPH